MPTHGVSRKNSWKVIIVGGGFCGAFLARLLDQRQEFEVTLIDKTNYFEFTPALPKLITDPDYLSKILLPYTHFLKHTKIHSEEVTRITPHSVVTEEKRLDFDYLVIATGINYPIPLENKENVLTVKSATKVVSMREKIRNADQVLIIGGGLIGTEVAGELATKTPEKEIILVHSHQRLIERTPPLASRFAQRFLEGHGVTFYFGEKVIQHKDGHFITEKQKIIDAELAFWCAGIEHDPRFMQKFPSSIFTGEKALRVNEFLQLVEYPNIFVGGDLTSIKEEKTAQNAKRHAKAIARNLIRKSKSKPLKKYGKSITPLVISLGSRSGLFVLSPFVLPGPIPALMKWGIEKIDMGRLSTTP